MKDAFTNTLFRPTHPRISEGWVSEVMTGGTSDPTGSSGASGNPDGCVPCEPGGRLGGGRLGGVRLGAVEYLNTKPLIYGLEEQLAGDSSLELALPSRLAEGLSRNLLDVALLPIVEYLRHRDVYRLISDAGIACRGPVWSVRILFRVPPAEAKSLGTDEGSRTSVALSQVLLASRFGRMLEQVPFPIGTQAKDCPADAVLIIGDRAMNPERYVVDFPYDWDLGLEWYRETGLPFVFAMWVAREEQFVRPQICRVLEESRDAGLRHVEELVGRYSDRYGLTQKDCRDYLTRYLQFYVGENELEGVEEFARRCVKLGLVPGATRE